MSRRLIRYSTQKGMANFSSASNKVSCHLLVCGGGSGGCSIAAKFASKLPKGSCIIVEPKDTHYYQPMWTLVGGGMKTLEQSGRPMKKVLPKSATWIKESVLEFHPTKNYIVTSKGTKISYEYMVVALGLDLHYDAIPGLEEALAVSDSGVCSNYSNKYVNRTLQCAKDFKSGNAIFTFPNTPIKCAGAPQKACYITDALLRKYGKRDKAKLKYKTSLPVIFGVKKYADRLWEVCKERDIEVGLRQELIEVKLGTKEAVFRNIDKPSEIQTEKFEMLHVCPPMSAPKVLRKCPDFTDGAGYLTVDKYTLQHTVFKNVFGIGDCTNLPTSRSASAVSGQNGVVGKNLSSVLSGKPPTAKYDGYTSCPLVTGLNRCILAEFDYSGRPLETFPIDQGKERYTSFLIKRDLLPIIYWNGLLNGYWNGPGVFRKLFRLGGDEGE